MCLIDGKPLERGDKRRSGWGWKIADGCGDFLYATRIGDYRTFRHAKGKWLVSEYGPGFHVYIEKPVPRIWTDCKPFRVLRVRYRKATAIGVQDTRAAVYYNCVLAQEVFYVVKRKGGKRNGR